MVLDCIDSCSLTSLFWLRNKKVNLKLRALFKVFPIQYIHRKNWPCNRSIPFENFGTGSLKDLLCQIIFKSDKKIFKFSLYHHW